MVSRAREEANFEKDIVECEGAILRYQVLQHFIYQCVR